MNEICKTKTPEAGEWWVSDRGVIAYVLGLTLNGDPAWQQKGSRLCLSDKIKFFLSCFHHQPRCTGFDWVEPPAEALARVRHPTMDCPDCGEFRGHGHVCIAEHTQQVRELTQRIGDLVQQVNHRDAVIEKIRTALRQEYSV